MKLENILFLDIETVPQHPTFDDLSEETQGLLPTKQNTSEKTPQPPIFMSVQGYGQNLAKSFVFLLVISRLYNRNPDSFASLLLRVMKLICCLIFQHSSTITFRVHTTAFVRTMAKSLTFHTSQGV